MKAMERMRQMVTEGASLSLGTVTTLEGESNYWRVNDDGDVEVDVVLHQHEVPVTALLSGLGGAGQGLWVLPPEGAEVLVAHAEGDYEGDAVIVGCLPTGDTPSGLEPGRVIAIGARVDVRAGDIRLGADSDALNQLQHGVVNGQGVDPFTGSTYGALGNASGKVLADK